MIRILVLALAAANLLYFGWSQWVRDEQPRLVAPQAAAAGASPSTSGAATSATQSCTSLGPAADEIRAMEIEQLLRDMQLVPITRTETGSMREGWWVYVPNADAAGQARTLQSIQNAGITDAFAMADDPDFRVSVGLFMEESGARSRAEIVRGLRLDATVQERMEQQTQVWFDLPGAARNAVDMARLADEGIEVQGLRLEDCPTGAER
ncbi:MAG TPA: hypothetical protein VMK82_04220 [Steroidobacteraceae bacterium]|nr:hypothetical protein [Steroidobacteraceae bacterium]